MMRSNDQRPVFIIGGSRTGSTMLETILSKSSDICITHELQYRNPFWLQRDFLQDVARHVGPLDDKGALDRLVKLVYSGLPVGWFWSASERMLNRDWLCEELSGKELSPQTIFDAVLQVHARMCNKKRIGAKFPLHYLYTDQLIEWYPDCLLLHTTRNPKAVYASQAAKYLQPGQGRVSRLYQRFKQFVHINIQISLTARLHRQLRHRSNYRLVRYEDLVTNPEVEIRKLCEFVEIDFRDDMLRPNQFGSSFDGIGNNKEGIERSSLDRWRTSISWFTAKTIDWLHPLAYRALGYARD